LHSIEWSGKLVSKILKLDIVKYFIIACLGTIIDFSISYLLYERAGLNYLLASNFGIICGFIFQYINSIKFIFKNNRFADSLIVFVVTFLFGIILTNITIWISFELIKLAFMISKVLSIGVSFFITYFIRKKLLGEKLNIWSSYSKT